MQLTYRDLGLVTPQLTASRDFYVQHLGFAAVYESDWYIHLKNGDIELGLLSPTAPNYPPDFHKPYTGDGVWFSFNVPDVDATYAELSAKQLRIEAPPQDEPWGERHFVVLDPNGARINLAHSIPSTM